MTQALTKCDDIEPIPDGSHYPEADIDTALLALCEFNNSRAAHEQLKAAGKEIPARTIRQWRKDYPGRYAALIARHRPKLDQILAADIRELARSKLSAQSDAVRLVHEKLLKGESKDPSQDLQRLSVATGIDIDKLGALEGRPMVHEHHHLDAQDRLQRLHDLAPALFPDAIDTTYEEIDADQDEGKVEDDQSRGEEIPR